MSGQRQDMDRPEHGLKATADHGHRRRPSSILLTAALLALVVLSMDAAAGYLAVVVTASIALLVTFFLLVFHSGRAFALALANLAGVYACVFLFFAESNFRQATVPALMFGFTLPLAAFAGGALRHRAAIGAVIRSGRMHDRRHLERVLAWLVPVFAIGAVTFLVPGQGLTSTLEDSSLLLAMAAISAIVFAVSRDVAVFLLDTGILFESFFQRISRLIVPAFAFLTFYSLLVIVFASLYAVVDRLSGGSQFRIDGVVRAITFPESLFFSVTTLSTVGYGEIAPVSNPVRLLTTLEIVSGILLLLFGFNEIFSFSRDHWKQDGHES